MSIVLLVLKNIEPFEALPSNQRLVMFGRSVFGISNSLLINFSIELIPLSLLIIIYQTYPFWASILSFFVNGE